MKISHRVCDYTEIYHCSPVKAVILSASYVALLILLQTCLQTSKTAWENIKKTYVHELANLIWPGHSLSLYVSCRLYFSLSVHDWVYWFKLHAETLRREVNGTSVMFTEREVPEPLLSPVSLTTFVWSSCSS